MVEQGLKHIAERSTSRGPKTSLSLAAKDPQARVGPSCFASELSCISRLKKNRYGFSICEAIKCRSLLAAVYLGFGVGFLPLDNNGHRPVVRA